MTQEDVSYEQYEVADRLREQAQAAQRKAQLVESGDYAAVAQEVQSATSLAVLRGMQRGLSNKEADALEAFCFSPDRQDWHGEGLQYRDQLIAQRRSSQPTGGGRQAATQSGGQVSSMAQADEAYAQGKLTHAEYKAAREKFGIGAYGQHNANWKG